MEKLDLVCINNGLAEGFAFHKQPDGAFEHDSVYPAAYACNGREGEMKMLVFDNGRLLKEFQMKFAPDIGSGPVMVFPAVGIIVHCDVLFEYDEEDEDEGPYKRTVVVDKLEFECQ